MSRRATHEISNSSGSLVHLAGLVVASGVSGAGRGAAGVAGRASVPHRWPMPRRGLRFAQNRSIPARASSWLSRLTITFERRLNSQELVTHERRSDVSAGTRCCLACGPSDRYLLQIHVTSDARKTRPTPGGPVHLGDAAAAGRFFLARGDRMDDRSSVDGVVARDASNLVAVDWGRHDHHRRGATGVDLPLPRAEPDGYGGHEGATRAGRRWPVSLDPAPVLRLCGVDDAGHFSDCSELVPVRDRQCRVLFDRHANAKGRRELDGSFRKQLSHLHGTDRPLRTENWGEPTSRVAT